MGSFNHTCTISKTTITPNQKARVFFLVENIDKQFQRPDKNFFASSFSGLNLYPWDHFRIIGYPLLATYEDCNFYHFDDKKMEELTLNCIRNIYYPNRVSENKTIDDYNSFHDYMNIEQLVDIEQVQKMLSKGALRVKTPLGISQVSIMAIHEDIYQKLILTHKIEDFQDYNKYYSFEYKNIEYLKELNEINIKDHVPEFHQCLFSLLEKDNISKENTQEIYNSLYENCYYKKQEKPPFIISTNFLKDIIKNPNYKKNIIEHYLGILFTAYWFDENNYELLPTLSVSEDDFNRDQEIKRLQNIIDIVSNIKD